MAAQMIELGEMRTEESGEVSQELTGLVDTTHLMKLFKRSELTIMLWRKKDGLPFVRIRGDARDTIRFHLPTVLEWAGKLGRRVYLRQPKES